MRGLSYGITNEEAQILTASDWQPSVWVWKTA